MQQVSRGTDALGSLLADREKNHSSVEIQSIEGVKGRDRLQGTGAMSSLFSLDLGLVLFFYLFFNGFIPNVEASLKCTSVW